MLTQQRFKNRTEAGRILAEELLRRGYRDRSNLVVLGLPRGGVPVAYEVARTLHASLDVFVVRKLGLPGQEELAMGAIATGGVRVPAQFDAVIHLDITSAVRPLEVAAPFEPQKSETYPSGV